MNNLFNIIEPLTTTEMLANYWHFLKSIDEKERSTLGPIEVVLKSRAVSRGWPVGLKNQTLALLSEQTLSTKSAIIFVDIGEVSSVAFSGVHLILPFISAGAIARSPLERKVSHAEAKTKFLSVCEEIKTVWSARIYFEVDPMTYSIDELINLTDVCSALLKAIYSQQENSLIADELRDVHAFHVLNSAEMKDIALTRRESGEVELAFHFSRALPKNLDDTMSALLVSIF